MKLAILAVLRSLSGYPDPPEVRDRHLDRVADVISLVARSPEEAAALIAQGHHESRFAAYVLEGRCLEGPKGHRCDPDREGPRAAGPWQVWRWCKGAHRNPGSDEALLSGAKCALSVMRLGLARCASWHGAFSALRGGGCEWKGAAARVQTMRSVLARLERFTG